MSKIFRSYEITNSPKIYLMGQSNFWSKVREHCVIAGSYAAYLVTDQDIEATPNDIDLFCNSEYDFEWLKGYLRNMSCIEQYNSVFAVSYDTKNSPLSVICKKIQLIKSDPTIIRTQFKTAEELLSYFDFSVCRIALDSNLEYHNLPTTYICDIDFHKDSRKKKIRIENIHCPVGTLKRVLKYTKKGYKTSTKDFMKIFQDWNDRGVDYQNTLLEAFLTDKYSKTEDGFPPDILKMLYID